MTDQDLIIKLREGDEQAFRELYSRHGREVFGFAYHLTHSAIDAEDILQETFLRLWTNREQLPDISHPGNYIFMIARNKTVDHLRKISRQQKLVNQVWANMSALTDDPAHQLDAKEYQRLVDEALAQLPAQKQTVFRLSRQQGLSHEEIALELGLSKSRVKNLLVETLKHIRLFLTRHSTLLAMLFHLAHASLLSP